MIPEAKELMDFILMECSREFNLGPDQLLGSSRVPGVATPRHALIYLLAEHVNANGFASLKELGRFLNKHHTSIINSRQVAVRMIRRQQSSMQQVVVKALERMEPAIKLKAEEIKKRGQYPIRLTFLERVEKLEADFKEIKAMLNGKS